MEVVPVSARIETTQTRLREVAGREDRDAPLGGGELLVEEGVAKALLRDRGFETLERVHDPRGVSERTDVFAELGAVLGSSSTMRAWWQGVWL